MKFLNQCLSFSLLLLLATPLAAQKDCYQKGLNEGKKLYAAGNYKQAIEAWEQAKKCRGADQAALLSLIYDASDADADGIVNGMDSCAFQFGPASKGGCPCFKPLRIEGIDHFYDKLYDEALRKWGEADTCEDKPTVSDLSDWTAKANEAAAQPPVIDPQPQEGELFKVVEENPVFPGGEAEMLKFIFTRIRYPMDARENGVEGMVVISFIVEKDGYISHSVILRGIGGGCGEEALRVVDEMPLWTPGKQGGKPVRVQFNLPIRFKLE